MKYMIITNNILVNEKYGDLSEHKNLTDLRFLEEKSFLEVLEYVRDHVHIGHTLLTHPLTGSIKPYETPYKSIVISTKAGEMDMDSLSIIENAIEVTKRFIRDYRPKDLKEKHHNDFKLIDLSLIASGIESINQFN